MFNNNLIEDNQINEINEIDYTSCVNLKKIIINNKTIKIRN